MCLYRRKILVLGRKNVGKSTLIKKLVNGNYCDINTRSPTTTKIHRITEILFIDDNYYECTFIDTPGLVCKNISVVDDVRKRVFSAGSSFKDASRLISLTQKSISIVDDDIKQEIHSADGLNLILFVYKYGEIAVEDHYTMAIFSGLFKNAWHISATVITCCDNLKDDQCRATIVKDFLEDPSTKQFSADLGGESRVYPISLPDLTRMEELAQEIHEKYVQKNLSKLHQLIERSHNFLSAQDILKGQNCSIM